MLWQSSMTLKSHIRIINFMNCIEKFINEPVREKTNNLDFRPGPTQTGLYSHRRWLEAGNFGFRKQMNCTIRVAITKALISFAVTDLRLCFRHYRLLVFPCSGSNRNEKVEKLNDKMTCISAIKP